MASLEPGRRLADRYVLKERLGDGGHAEVWSAHDERDDRLVALKFLHLRSCTADEALPMLRHEARMAQRLTHPGVLRVDDPQRHGDDVFLPVEYAPGGGAVRLRGAPWRRVLPVLLQVARVLEHAHERGVVHRDIKPGNVLFSAGGLVRVADFGTSAHTGSSEALAAGSPFSASPQQLRGEPASPADDVYGLGALTHELLTRYPPFYPQFDATRVQAEDPPRPVASHPAPEALLDLVQAMLAREAAARPGLGAVIREFERLLALPADATEQDAVMIEAAPAQPPAARSRPMPPAWGWLAAAATAGLAVLVLLPEPPPAPVQSVAPQVTTPTLVADAVIADPPAAPASVANDVGPAQVEASPAVRTDAATLEDELQAGERALQDFRPAEARAAFRRALSRDAASDAAKAGLAAAARQADLLADMGEGARAEAAGELESARAHYRLLLANQPDFAPALSALGRVEARLAGAALEAHLVAGAQALRQGRVAEAEAAYAQAAAISPRDPRLLDGQQRLAEIHRDRQNALDLARGAQLEQAERWSDAVVHYGRVLERDAGLRFAEDGRARSQRRAALDEELASYQAAPDRLTAPAVRQAAQRALARGHATDAATPRLQAQLAWLRDTLATLAEPVRVELTSDNSTLVSVVPVGELGSFQTRALELPPGQYTVIGRRDGFRDVRHELNLAPGQRHTTLLVRCTERI